MMDVGKPKVRRLRFELKFCFNIKRRNSYCDDWSFTKVFIEKTKIIINLKLFGTEVPLSRAYSRVT